jgi:hypothetical protein
MSDWREDPKPSYLELRELYQGAASLFAGKERKVLCRDLIEGVFQHLGFTLFANVTGFTAKSPKKL